jgi:hypothetical protein
MDSRELPNSVRLVWTLFGRGKPLHDLHILVHVRLTDDQFELHELLLNSLL